MNGIKKVLWPNNVMHSVLGNDRGIFSAWYPLVQVAFVNFPKLFDSILLGAPPRPLGLRRL